MDCQSSEGEMANENSRLSSSPSSLKSELDSEKLSGRTDARENECSDSFPLLPQDSSTPFSNRGNPVTLAQRNCRRKLIMSDEPDEELPVVCSSPERCSSNEACSPASVSDLQIKNGAFFEKEKSPKFSQRALAFSIDAILRKDTTESTAGKRKAEDVFEEEEEEIFNNKKFCSRSETDSPRSGCASLEENGSGECSLKQKHVIDCDDIVFMYFISGKCD